MPVTLLQDYATNGLDLLQVLTLMHVNGLTTYRTTPSTNSEGSRAVAGSNMQDNQPCFPLLALPQLPLVTVIQSLQGQDRWRFVCSCRRLAAVRAESSATQIKVTSSTSWDIFCKVIDRLTIPCTSMCVKGKAATKTCEPEPVGCCFWRAKPVPVVKTAVDVLLQPGEDLGLCIPGVRRLRIDAHALPCLLPTRLVSLLPDLEELDVVCEADRYANDADLQPIPFCSSLRKLRCSAECLHLPSKYHTSEELRRQLPNVVSLEIWSLLSYKTMDNEAVQSCVEVLVNAWSGQLNEFTLNAKTPVQLQRCRNLQSLRWNADGSVMFAGCLPVSLTRLQCSEITELQLQAILELPLLRMFEFDSFCSSLCNHWSNKPCPWQKLKVRTLPMAYLSQLPLKSLENLTIEYLELPDPLLPDSLSMVHHAAQCVSNAGITVENFRDWKLQRSQTLLGEASAPYGMLLTEMMRSACRVVTPCQSYQLDYQLAMYAQVRTEIIRWLSPELRQLTMSDMPTALARFWETLRDCRKLVQVEFHIGACNLAENVAALVLHASNYYVAVTHRPVMLCVICLRRLYCWDQEETNQRIVRLQQEELPTCVILEEYAWLRNNCYEPLMIRLTPREQGYTPTPTPALPSHQ